jgi:toxin-antitoxin system PIN domain toxin
MQFLPDINVWIALSYEGHVHHQRALAWFSSLGPGGRFFFCRFTQLGFLRLLTAEPIMGPDDVMDQPAAWSAYDIWLENERVTFLEEPPDIDPLFRSLTRLRRPATKDWADSYLSAFAAAAELRIVTFDRTLQRKSRRSTLLRP